MGRVRTAVPGGRRHRSGRHGFLLAALAAAALMLAAACGSSTTDSATGPVKEGGSLTFALDEDVAGFNPLQATDNEFVLQEILDQVYPQVFVTQPDLSSKLDTEVVTSAQEVNTSPQTIVYTINPKARWSDGVPITAQDFIYNWQAQSGLSRYKDVGGKAFLAAGTAGYNQIKSVTGPHGDRTVTVVFAKPFGDWQALFAPLIPAHIAQKIGFDGGFQTFGTAEKVSGGPYEIQSYTKGEDLIEVRNPHYWGPRGKLARIIFRFVLDDDQDTAAIENGEADMVDPALASTTYYDSVKGISGFTTEVKPGLEFQHMDFNEANPYLASLKVRQAIAYGTNRQQMVTRIVDPLHPFPAIGPLDNRIFMPTQPEYVNTSGGYGLFDPGQATSLLKSDGMAMGSDGYFHPTWGPEKGQDLTLSISTTSGVPVRADIEELFQADMKKIGVKIQIKNYDANTLFGTVGPHGEFDIIEFAWVSSPFASGNQALYCSFTDAAICGDNWNHFADSQVNRLFHRALTTTNPGTAAVLYNQADAVLWQQMATLPLFQQPQLFGWSSSYGNVIPNTSSTGIPWNASQWGVRA